MYKSKKMALPLRQRERITPEQLRTLAREGNDNALLGMPESVLRYVLSSAVALMNAADALEADTL